MSPDRPVRVRFAPSPTGLLHVGGARTALFNWAFARHHDGAFLLRIEDTDRERNTQESLDSILASLRWLGLDWDEGPEIGGDFGPYFQSERAEGYVTAATRGLEEGWLYRCFCSKEILAQDREEQQAAKESLHYRQHCRSLKTEESLARSQDEAFSLRFAVSPGESISVCDHIRGEVVFSSDEVEDWIAVRTDGSPTYNFVCALDDAAMEISHVIRGEEHLVNTPKQLLVCRALGFPEPDFAHVPLILGQDGKKLSKRTGDTALEDYQSSGHPPEAMLNFLGLLGFSIDDHTTVFSAEEMVAAFDLKRINRSGALFDTDKLAWLCAESIRTMDVDDLLDRVRPWLPDGQDGDWLQSLVAAYQERIGLYGDLPTWAAWALKEDWETDAKAAKALADSQAEELLATIADRLDGEESFPPAEFPEWIKAQAESMDLGMGKLMKPMRAALCGTLGGPPMEEILALLGRERCLTRLRVAKISAPPDARRTAE